ncbi:MAG: NfeD family protein [Limisphaerales bacterium]
MAAVAALLVAGILLLTLEVFLPGLVSGIAGLICLGAGVLLAYRDFGAVGGNTALGLTGFTLVVGFFVWLRYFPGSAFGQRFVSQGTVGEIGAEKPELLDQTGVALTALRPSGAALIGGRRIDVVTEGPMVVRGSPIRVVAVEGMRVVVRKTGS